MEVTAEGLEFCLTCVSITSPLSQKGDFEVDQIIDGPFISAEDLRHGQDNGCPSCPVLLGIYERLSGEQGWPDCGYDGLDVSLRPWAGGKLPDVGRLRFQVHGQNRCSEYREVYACTGNYVGLRLPNLLVASPATYSKARTWIEECFTKHQICPRKNTPRLPTRVLDILVSDGDADIRLHISNGTQAQYVALSYCWGGPQIIHTTKQNLMDHMHRIEYSSLPQTLKDAVIVTRNLGVRYLWIDSLCILQDDVTDKRLEISQMASIYRNSYVTLVAASPGSCQQGFLEDRPVTNLEKGTPFPFRCPDGTLSCVYLFEFDTNNRSHDPVVVDRLDRKDPIDQRGWTLQERVLAPRKLVYGSRQLFWECRRVMLPDGGHDDFPRFNALAFSEFTGLSVKAEPNPTLNSREIADELLHRRIYDNVHSLEGLPSDNALNASASDNLRKQWLRLVQEYTSRKMSVSSDKLPGISALASHYYEHINDTYLAGLWRSTLLKDLMWAQWSWRGFPFPNFWTGPTTDYKLRVRRAISPERLTPKSISSESNRPSSYRAPSWSWAAVDANRIKYMNCSANNSKEDKEDKYMPVTTLIDCRTLLIDTSDQFGEVKSGVLILRGPLTRLLLVRHNDRFYLAQENSVDILLDAYLDVIGEMQFKDSEASEAAFYGLQNIPIWCICLAIWAEDQQAERLMEDGQQERANWIQRRTCGMMLRRRDSRTFERIGYFEGERAGSGDENPWFENCDQDVTIV